MPRRNEFSARRTGAVAGRVLTQIRRDRRTLAMMLVMPAIIMLIFGFALGGQVSNVPILVDNQDSGYTASIGTSSASLHLGDQVVQLLRGDSTVSVSTGTYGEGVSGVDSGIYSAAILIPSNFSQISFQKSKGENVTPSIEVYLDGTKPSLDSGVLGALQGSIQNTSGANQFSLIQNYAFGGAKFSGLDVSLPSVIAFVLTFLILLISLLTITRETTAGTLPRLYTTPLTALERLLGYTIALLLLAIVTVAVILLIGVGLFGVVVRGNLALLFGSGVFYALANVLLAVFLSNFAKNELQAVQLAPIIAFPSMALSGMLVPVAALPTWIQPFSRLIPMYYANQMFEGVMLKGYDIGTLSLSFVVVIIMELLFFILAMSTVKDKMS